MFSKLTTAALCVLTSTVAGQQLGDANHNVVNGLLSDCREQRIESEEQITKSRNATVTELIALIENKDHRRHRPDSVYRAMRLLGKLRAGEGAPILVQHVGFPYLAEQWGEPMRAAGPLTFEGKSHEELFPAVRALIEIGEPSIDVILAEIAKTDDLVKINAYFAVLRALERKNAIRERLHQIIEKASPRRQKVLRIVVTWLDDPPKSIFP